MQQSYLLPPECIYVFCLSVRAETFALYIISHRFFNCGIAYCAVRPGSLNKTDYVSSLKGLPFRHIMY